MNIHIPFFILFPIGEAILALLFLLTAALYDKQAKIDLKSIVKGIAERGFLCICLINDYPHALTFFSALKLGTRLKRDDANAAEGIAFNDYYLLGNIASVTAAIFYAKCWPGGL